MKDNRHAAMEAAKELQAYAATPAARALLSLLDALDGAYSDDLRGVSPENLGRKQGAAAQVRVLRQVLTVSADDCPLPIV